jgi:hypothetical protein
MPYPPPATEEAHAHYRGLMDSECYLPLDRMRDRFVYLIHARNSYIGIWILEKRDSLYYARNSTVSFSQLNIIGTEGLPLARPNRSFNFAVLSRRARIAKCSTRCTSRSRSPTIWNAHVLGVSDLGRRRSEVPDYLGSRAPIGRKATGPKN